MPTGLRWYTNPDTGRTGLLWWTPASRGTTGTGLAWSDENCECCPDDFCCGCAPQNLKATFTQINIPPDSACADSSLDGLVINDLDYTDNQDCPQEWAASVVTLDCGFIELEFKCDATDQYVLEDIDSGGAFNILNDPGSGKPSGFELISTQCDPFRIVFRGYAAHEQGCCDTDDENGPYYFEVVIEEDV